MTEDSAEKLLRQAAELQRQGRRREAIETYRRLLARRADLTDCWYELGYLLRQEGDYDAALAAYAEALARGIRDPQEVHLNRAVIYSDHLRRDDDAERELEAALALDPDYAPALLNLGNLHEERGRLEAAAACYERIVSAAEGEGGNRQAALRFEALGRLAQLRPPSGPDDPLLRRLKEAADTPALDALTRANLSFSLGRALDALGAYDDAFAAFEDANRHARRPGPAYDRVGAERAIDALVAAFPAAPRRAPESAAEDERGAAPIFICGMFRSGSTLIEQALSCHPRVTAGGELDFLPRLAARDLAPFPASMAGLDATRLESHAREYLAHLARLFPEADENGCYVTDKRPDNFLLIGLVKRLFPAAKIIHTTRNPLDNGLSIFFQHLDQRAMSYSSELGAIGHYYGQYRRLMAHWKTLFAESVFDFDYDAFVRDPKPALAALLAFLGLDWRQECLEFHRRGNTVKTASYWQVRRPLYGEASGRRRNYERHLGPLRDALAECGVIPKEQRPAADA